MGFPSNWIEWVRAIFVSSKISVLVNGSPTKEFSPIRGLRQGDPLSPLLFNLIREVLSKMLSVANDKKVFYGILLPNCRKELTHLQFADDIIIFIKNDPSSIKAVKRVLQCFQVLSGLKINFQIAASLDFR